MFICFVNVLVHVRHVGSRFCLDPVSFQMFVGKRSVALLVLRVSLGARDGPAPRIATVEITAAGRVGPQLVLDELAEPFGRSDR